MKDWFKQNVGGNFKMVEVDGDPKQLDPNLGMLDDEVVKDEDAKPNKKKSDKKSD